LFVILSTTITYTRLKDPKNIVKPIFTTVKSFLIPALAILSGQMESNPDQGKADIGRINFYILSTFITVYIHTDENSDNQQNKNK